MMRRRRLLLVLLVLLPLPAIAYICIADYERPVSQSRFEKIQAGMTLEEVTNLLGGQPGDYSTGNVHLYLRSGCFVEFLNVMHDPEILLGERNVRHEWWTGDEGVAWVCFDENGRVLTKEFTPGASDASIFDKLCRWLGYRH